jgi:hypothetical protein
MQNVRLGETRYNDRAGAFEARVDVTRGDVTFRYPARVIAPPDADQTWVASALVRNALGQSDTPTLH